MLLSSLLWESEQCKAINHVSEVRLTQHEDSAIHCDMCKLQTPQKADGQLSNGLHEADAQLDHGLQVCTWKQDWPSRALLAPMLLDRLL